LIHIYDIGIYINVPAFKKMHIKELFVNFYFLTFQIPFSLGPERIFQKLISFSISDPRYVILHIFLVLLFGEIWFHVMLELFLFMMYSMFSNICCPLVHF
ncbi:hypothetical protein ACJX0J_038168, partial [Zea mays]